MILECSWSIRDVPEGGRVSRLMKIGYSHTLRPIGLRADPNEKFHIPTYFVCEVGMSLLLFHILRCAGEELRQAFV
jgi:hypothetical protein